MQIRARFWLWQQKVDRCLRCRVSDCWVWWQWRVRGVFCRIRLGCRCMGTSTRRTNPRWLLFSLWCCTFIASTVDGGLYLDWHPATYGQLLASPCRFVRLPTRCPLSWAIRYVTYEAYAFSASVFSSIGLFEISTFIVGLNWLFRCLLLALQLRVAAEYRTTF